MEIKFNAVSPDFLDVIGTRVIARARIHAGRRPERPAGGADQPGHGAEILAGSESHRPGGEAHGLVARRRRGPRRGRNGKRSHQPDRRDARTLSISAVLAVFLTDMGEITFAMQTGMNAMSLAQPARQALIRHSSAARSHDGDLAAGIDSLLGRRVPDDGRTGDARWG